MRGQAPWICDNCGKKRESDVNHWAILIPETGAAVCILRIAKWDEGIAGCAGARHACGAECRNVLTERYFATGSFAIPKPAVVTYESRDVLDAALERARAVR